MTLVNKIKPLLYSLVFIPAICFAWQWYNPNVDQRMLQAKFNVDNNDCTVKANQSFPDIPRKLFDGAVAAGNRFRNEDHRVQYYYDCMTVQGWERR